MESKIIFRAKKTTRKKAKAIKIYKSNPSDVAIKPPPTRLERFNNITIRTKVFFVLGCLFLIISLGWHLNQTIQLMYFPPSLKATQGQGTHNQYPLPIEITIPKVDINLPIEETAINRGVWQISRIGASHLTISARPGEKGAIIMYSHNTNERFGPIRWLSKGDSIKLKTADNKTHTYKITQTMTVSPNQMDVFTQNKGETLILYTCDGFADLQRFVIIAKPSV
jgi:LPXTG-site transpeptidase (sortase) family protein